MYIYYIYIDLNDIYINELIIDRVLSIDASEE